MEEYLLKVTDLHVEREDREILRGVDLCVKRNTVHAVLGLNGSGKSTLAYTLMGSVGYTPSRGSIWFDGEDITRLSMTERGKRGLTLAWQEPARIEGLTVARYLTLGMLEKNMERAREALRAVDLDPDSYLQRFVDDSLSGGERKKVELAAIYAMAPRLAILDEPDSGIDTQTLADTAKLIRRMADEGTTVLLISHRDEVVELADTASLMCEGRITSTGDPHKVCDHYTRHCRPCQVAAKVEMEGDYERL